MTALPKSALPETFTNELARLSRAGFPLLPLGGGDDGKAPLSRNWSDPNPTLGHVLAPLHRTGSQVYGVRLDGLAVIDCDSDSPELVAKMEARFGPSPVHVKTPRGRHLYYRAGGPVPNLRGEGVPVDIKTGPRAYVVGPLSVRPDGGAYEPVRGFLGVDCLPLIRATEAPQGARQGHDDPAPVLTGYRHVELVREAIGMVENVDSAVGLLLHLRAFRERHCVDPVTMPDSELEGIGTWAWTCRLENRVYSGRDSSFPLCRKTLDMLRTFDTATEAIELVVLLWEKHGHIPGKPFALDFKAMRAAGLTRLSEKRLRKARRTLEGIGVLKVAGNHHAGSVRRTYRLCKLRQPGANDANTVGLSARKGAGGGGGGS